MSNQVKQKNEGEAVLKKRDPNYLGQSTERVSYLPDSQNRYASFYVSIHNDSETPKDNHVISPEV